jgi:U3 small nucleolar ribonucleoprotein protein IMP4
MIVSHFPHGPTVYFTLHNVTLRHDIASYKSSTVSEQYPHLIFENFSSKLGERIRDVLKYLFPVPKEDSKRVMTFSNENDFISFRCVCRSSCRPTDLTNIQASCLLEDPAVGTTCRGWTKV